MKNFSRIYKLHPQVTVLLLLIGSSTAAASNTFATELNVKEVWELVQKNSKVNEASDHILSAAKINASRNSNHWLPRLYLDARTYSTNDPGSSLFSKLGQREVSASDFSPNLLNNPKSQWYQRATLGLDLPLYEGGYKVALQKSSAQLENAELKNKQATEISLYSAVLHLYGNLIRISEERAQFEQLHQQLKTIQTKYRIGSESNPVGYSGSLGMKALQNRIETHLELNQAEKQNIQNEFSALSNGILETTWNPAERNFLQYLNLHRPKEIKIAASAQAMEHYAKAAYEQVKAAAAPTLPKIGMFAEGYGNRGERATGTGYTAGLYLQWNIFDATSWNSSKEARHKAIAFDAKASSVKLENEAKQKSSDTQLNALLIVLQKMEETLSLSKEQTAVSLRLFNNGAINALQFVEVLSRRADVIETRSRLQTNALFTLQEQWMTSTENL